MSLATIILLVVAGTVVNADVKEPPYEPSGWKPSGPAFLLPITRNQATTVQLNNEPFPPLAPPPAFAQSDRQFIPSFQVPVPSTPNFTPSTRPLTSTDRRLAPPPNKSTERQFTSPFGAPASTPSDFPPSTRPPSPAEDRISASDNRARNNPVNQDNQPFVHKSESVLSIVRPLQDLSESDDQALLNQNQSPFPKQYLSPPERVVGRASLTDLSPLNDNVADYSPSLSHGGLTYQPLADSKSSAINNKPLSAVDNTYDVTNRPTQEYGVPLLEGGSSLKNAPRVFFVVLPTRQVIPTGTDSKETQAFTSGFTGRLPSPTKEATRRRFPRTLFF